MLIFCYTAIRCNPPEPGTATKPLPADVADGMSYLQTYTYSCLDGYRTDNELCTVCQPNGTLSSPAPMCSRKLLKTTPKAATLHSVDNQFWNELSNYSQS